MKLPESFIAASGIRAYVDEMILDGVHATLVSQNDLKSWRTEIYCRRRCGIAIGIPSDINSRICVCTCVSEQDENRGQSGEDESQLHGNGGTKGGLLYHLVPSILELAPHRQLGDVLRFT